MKKYRLRLANGRVIGPLKLEQFSELFSKKRIKGNEDCQLYPTGDWLKISDFPEIIESMNTKVSSEENTEATFIKKLSDLKKEVDSEDGVEDEAQENIEYPQKFEFEKKTAFTQIPEVEETEIIEEDSSPQTVEDSEEIDSKGELTETIVEEKSPSAPSSDKTIVTLDTKKYLEELKKQEAENKIKEEEERERLKQEEEAKVDLDNDSTQFINLADLKDSVQEDLKKSEKELKLEEKEFQKEMIAEQKRIEKAKALREQEEEDEDEDEYDESGAKKKKLIIVVAALAILYVLLFPDEGKKKPKKIVPVPPTISFPQSFDKPSAELSAQAHKKAIELLKKPTYVNKIKASRLLLKSAENQFKNNAALGRLIYIYSDLLDNSNTKTDDANTIFKLVQIFKTKALIDPLYCSGVAYFYLKTGKPAAAVKVVEKYRDVGKGKTTLEVLSVYLTALQEVGDLINAKKIAEKIRSVPSNARPLDVEVALINYFFVVNDYTTASEIVAASIKKFPESVPILLSSARLLIYQEDFKSLGAVLKKIRLLEAERSKIYYSKYLEYRALEAVSKQDIKKATALFKKALTVHESLELRTRLSSLSESTDSDANLLITESKSLQFIMSSKNYIKKNNWKFAFKDALEATRVAPHYIKAKLHLAELQIKQSIFAEAINNLEGLYKEDPHNPEIVFTLMDAYIEAYKFSDVKRIFTMTATSDIRNMPRYYSLTAKYYVYKNDFNNAISWLQMAINKNPLDDNNIYVMANMFIKYSKFDKAKAQLNKAMDLDPTNILYRVSYSEILYELEGSDAAIGYLYDVLQDFPDNPKLLSQIGIFYYRSGQQKSYDNVKEKLTKLPHRDTSLHEFLIEAAKLDGKNEIVVEQSKKIIQLNPGDLKTRLALGKIYMDMDKYKEALIEFKAIESRLETYPKLQYYMSKLYLLTDNIDKAAELAQKEIKANPSVEDGYILLGDIYRKKREFLNAEKQYKKAQKINGENVDMLLGLATVNFKKSQYEIALDLFKKARDNEPSRAEIHKLLGDAYRKTSQSSLAIESYKMFLELSPNSKYKDEINTYIRMME